MTSRDVIFPLLSTFVDRAFQVARVAAFCRLPRAIRSKTGRMLALRNRAATEPRGDGPLELMRGKSWASARLHLEQSRRRPTNRIPTVVKKGESGWVVGRSCVKRNNMNARARVAKRFTESFIIAMRDRPSAFYYFAPEQHIAESWADVYIGPDLLIDCATCSPHIALYPHQLCGSSVPFVSFAASRTSTVSCH